MVTKQSLSTAFNRIVGTGSLWLIVVILPFRSHLKRFGLVFSPAMPRASRLMSYSPSSTTVMQKTTGAMRVRLFCLAETAHHGLCQEEGGELVLSALSHTMTLTTVYCETQLKAFCLKAIWSLQST